MSTIINATTTNGVVIQPDNSGSLVLQTNSGTTALTIDTSQNVGIGTTSPAFRLDVSGGHARIRGAQALFWSNSDNTNAVSIYNAGSTGSTSGQMVFETSNSTERMRIDSSGYVTKPYQVAFNAYNAASGDPVLWATANLNIGSGYNTGTGRFTAPIAGRYLIYISLHAGAGLGRADFRLKVNGGDREGGAASQSSTYTQGTGIAVLQLAASDYVTVQALASFSNVQALSYFGGYLLG
jgi:hypothetical protein